MKSIFNEVFEVLLEAVDKDVEKEKSAVKNHTPDPKAQKCGESEEEKKAESDDEEKKDESDDPKKVDESLEDTVLRFLKV